MVLEVELAGANAAKEALQPVKFTFTVDGIDNPGPQKASPGTAVEIPVRGVGLGELKAAKALPEGLTLKKNPKPNGRSSASRPNRRSSKSNWPGRTPPKKLFSLVKFTFTVGGITSPGPQTAVVGTAVNIPVSGDELAQLAVTKALPEGLSLEEISETEWKIVGTPTTPGVGEVELTGETSAKEPLPAVTFTFTVDGFENPGAQTALVGSAVAVPVTGVGLSELTAAGGLPEGLRLEKVSESEWKILGTPTRTRRERSRACRRKRHQSGAPAHQVHVHDRPSAGAERHRRAGDLAAGRLCRRPVDVRRRRLVARHGHHAVAAGRGSDSGGRLHLLRSAPRRGRTIDLMLSDRDRRKRRLGLSHQRRADGP